MAIPNHRTHGSSGCTCRPVPPVSHPVDRVGHRLSALGRVAVALILTMALASPATAATVVSTSGVPHGDIGDYTRSAAWRPGMPTGANWRWRRYMRTTVDNITAGSPDLVIHGGDMVEGRWERYWRGPEVFGPDNTDWQKRRIIRRAGNIMYSWISQWWDGHNMAWAMGDHEIGDMGHNGIIEAWKFRARAHDAWNAVWADHFGKARYSRRVGRVGVIVLDPFLKKDGAVYARISDTDRKWMKDRAARMRSRGARWVIVYSELPFLRPPPSNSSSNTKLLNGWQVYLDMKAVGVDLAVLALTGEVHQDGIKRANKGPWQITHGGRHLRSSWLTMTEQGDELQLTLRRAVGRAVDDTKVWAMAGAMLPRKPVARSPVVTGKATLHSDGRLTDRSGALG
jgi:hypothetical protein